MSTLLIFPSTISMVTVISSMPIVLAWCRFGPSVDLVSSPATGLSAAFFCCGEHAVRPPPTMAATPAVTPPRTKPLRKIPVLISSILPYHPVNDCSFRCI